MPQKPNPFEPGSAQEQVRRLTSRKPQRLTITVSWKLYDRLIHESNLEGRSLSNLACFWLEQHAEERPPSTAA